ncbi:MAG TPA: FAD-linked oxidase C-terminal domain-containing protein [Gaiellaceae bacterium]|nr:FAD-linked oxidase C-terminal domain-containing protein [Gaiellaceae bacterium]
MLTDDLSRALGEDVTLSGDVSSYLVDETETRSIKGHADAVVLPSTTVQVASIVSFAYARDIPITVRGGGTGYSGGAVPTDGGIVLSLERMNRIRASDPFQWRMEVEAGVTTERVRHAARQNGLYFPPDPGAGEQSHIGGNIATNAGGPHAFKYGTVGAWVTGLELVVPPGDVVHVGGPLRKDVASYDLKRLVIGSEGTLAIVTSAWLRLIPMPEASQAVVAVYPDCNSGVEAIETVLGSGLGVAALEYLDRGSLEAAPPRFFESLPSRARFAVLCEVDGSASETVTLTESVLEALQPNALAVHAPSTSAEVAAVWRWREGLTAAVTAQRGGKVSEDIVVPLDKLGDAIAETVAIGERAGLPACSWGHAGDGNLHSTFLVDRENPEEIAAAEQAAQDLFRLAVALGGSISGEHGVGLVKTGHLSEMLGARAYDLHMGVKQLFDPKGLLNPGKKI